MVMKFISLSDSKSIKHFANSNSKIQNLHDNLVKFFAGIVLIVICYYYLKRKIERLIHLIFDIPLLSVNKKYKCIYA